MSLQAKSFDEALQRARIHPQKPRKALKRTNLGRNRPAPSENPDPSHLLNAGRNGRLRRPSAKKKGKRAKRLTDGQLKKKVWVQFSIFIRTRGADDLGFVRCVTCHTVKFWKELQAGHFVLGRLNANLFDERGCYPQCYPCNIHFQGNVVIFYKWMLANYGQAVIDELLEQNSKTKKWMPGELQGLLDHYKSLNAANPIVALENP